MAVAFDAVSASANFSAVSSVSWTHTAGASANYVRVHANCQRNNAGATMSATYNTVAMTQVGISQGTDFGGDQSMAVIFEKIAPPTGAITAEVTISAGSIFGGACGSISFTGVHQTVASGTPSTGGGSTGTTNTETIACSAGDMVSDSILVYEATTGLTNNQTLRFSDDYFGTNAFWGAGQTAAGGASVDMTWSWNANKGFFHVAASILQAEAVTEVEIVRTSICVPVRI